MARHPRIDPEDGWHHVMNRGVDRRPIFFDDNDRIEIGQQLADIHDRFGIETHAYCLMGNHFHFLLHCPEAGLSAGMQRLGSVYTRHVNDRHGRDGPLLRGRFHSRHITEQAHLLHACRYIHRNALDIAGVGDVAAYRWSSHRTYLGHRRVPSWMRISVVLSHFDHDRAAFDAFVRSDVGPASTDRGPRMVTALLGAVRTSLNVRGEHGDDRHSHAARAVTLWLTDRLSVDRATVMEVLAIPSEVARRSALSRARTRVAADEVLLRAALDALDLVGIPARCVASGV